MSVLVSSDAVVDTWSHMFGFPTSRRQDVVFRRFLTHFDIKVQSVSLELLIMQTKGHENVSALIQTLLLVDNSI